MKFVKIAAKIPSGTAITSDNAVIPIVFNSAGIKDAFSEVYFNANRSGVRCGSPLIKMYAIKNKRTAKVATADNITRSIKINDPGLRL